jgi:hypothetical protein
VEAAGFVAEDVDTLDFTLCPTVAQFLDETPSRNDSARR